MGERQTEEKGGGGEDKFGGEGKGSQRGKGEGRGRDEDKRLEHQC